VKLHRNAQDGVQAHDWWGWSRVTICNTRVGRSTSLSNCYLRQVPIYCPCFVRASEGCTSRGRRRATRHCQRRNETRGVASSICRRWATGKISGRVLLLQWRTAKCAAQSRQMQEMDSPVAGGHDSQCAASLAIATPDWLHRSVIMPYPSHGNDMFPN
jgi:hypothetical protein